MFGPSRGEWDGDWRGWWGEEPPYHAPVFVLTHHPHDPIASAVRQAFVAGAVDELVLHVVPVLLVRGERLVDGVADPGFTQVEVVPTPYATHLRYRVNH